MSARSRRLGGSLGDSWGDAEYSSDADRSIYTASDLSGVGSESELEEDEDYTQERPDVAMPLPSRTTRATSKTPQDTAVNTPTRRGKPQTPTSSGMQSRTSHSTPETGTESLEPSLVMPSLYDSQDAPTRTAPRASEAKEEQPEVSPWYYLNILLQHVFWPLVRYLIDVLSYAMVHFMKPILATALVIFLGVSAAQMTSGFLANKIHTALTPLCFVPGSSYILPFCAAPQYDSNNANFEELVNVQASFEDILDASKDSFALPATMKSSEMAIRDLRTLVKWSRLPSRSQLEVEFGSFIELAREASADLAKYNSKIGATIDRVISTNSWTMNVLEGLAEKETQVGGLSRLLGTFITTAPTLQERIFDQYILHVGKNKEDIAGLIQAAEALLQLLNHLEERLDLIADIAIRDDHSITKNREELLSLLWTKLGGNSATRKGFDKSLTLLKQVSMYRKEAIKHVGETLLKLQEISAGLETLRDGVAAPEVLGYREEVPLTYYLDVVEKGVERLRDARGESLRVEGDSYRRAVRGGGGGADDRGLPGQEMPIVYAKSSGKN
ncbi:hypothetical protein BDV95DRAFT_549091 [Massariosphaeria phaeospora]|uniref:Uncharacterized protein n=1 Tax=Massariosphaeria phaeospora TaxID=100035 RepID=A0A7C8MJP3_9PLEO|nr:hypothetical protein BDV95DRAFT_549091 [Massariosphaeria phaeospora]